MRHGIKGGSAAVAALLCLSTLILTPSAAASAAETVTETIQGEQLLIESTTTPGLFTALAPGDVVEWDVSISTRDPAETIEAELFLVGDLPVEAAVLSCEEPWSTLPNSGSHAASCEDPADVVPAQQVLHKGYSTENFEVPQEHHLRLVLQAGSFAAEDSGEVYLRVTAEGEHLDARPPTEEFPPQQPEGAPSAEEEPETDPSSGGHQETAAATHRAESPSSDMQESQRGEQPSGLPATGASVALLLLGASFLLGVGTYLRRRSGSSSAVTDED